MAEQTPPLLHRFVAEKVVLLQTRKRDGRWVDTAVNIAVQGDRAFFRTPARASKNKRLGNYAECRICPCTWGAKPTGPWVRATANLLPGSDSAAARQLINRKYPILQRFLVPLVHRVMRTETLHYELTGVRELTS